MRLAERVDVAGRNAVVLKVLISSRGKVLFAIDIIEARRPEYRPQTGSLGAEVEAVALQTIGRRIAFREFVVVSILNARQTFKVLASA